MNLLFSMDRNYISVWQNCMRSILQNGGADSYAVYILHSDLSQEDRSYIRSRFPSVSFSFVEADPSLFDGFPVSQRYPVQIYYRLAAPLLLPKSLERILYLDGDTIIINSLQKLYDMDFEGSLLVGCSHTGQFLNAFNRVRLGMEKPVPYINSGVMLFNLPLLRKELSLADIQQYASGRDLILFLPDQDMLTALYGDKVKLADTRRYNLGEKTIIQNNVDPTRKKITLEWIRSNTSIIHYYGKNKPWKDNYIGVLDEFWKNTALHKELYLVENAEKARNLHSSLVQSAYVSADWFFQFSQANVRLHRFGSNQLVLYMSALLQNPALDAVVFHVAAISDSLDPFLEQLDLKYCCVHREELPAAGKKKKAAQCSLAIDSTQEQ